MQQFFLEGGAGMFPTALFGFIALVLACVYAVHPRARLVPLIAGTGGAALLAGALGMVMGFRTTITAVIGSRAIEPERLQAVTLAGMVESSNNLVLALVLATLVALTAGVGGFRSGAARVPVRP